ncbi:hypothetical protein RZS08_11095, partial [Arthrospira platensis SPKY1]|nr:hypothetical protein [Arthrospira platensis SPKY1]
MQGGALVAQGTFHSDNNFNGIADADELAFGLDPANINTDSTGFVPDVIEVLIDGTDETNESDDYHQVVIPASGNERYYQMAVERSGNGIGTLMIHQDQTGGPHLSYFFLDNDGTMPIESRFESYFNYYQSYKLNQIDSAKDSGDRQHFVYTLFYDPDVQHVVVDTDNEIITNTTVL